MEKELVVANLRKQKDLLGYLVDHISERDELDHGTRLLYDEVTKQVEENLKQLKKIRKNFKHQALFQINFINHKDKT